MKAMRPVPSCPPFLRPLAKDAVDDEVSALVRRLLCDLEMEDVWRRLVSADIGDAGLARAFAAMMGRRFIPEEAPEFAKLSNRERIIWLNETRRTVEKLLELLGQSPILRAENILVSLPNERMKRFLSVLSVDVATKPTIPPMEVNGRWTIDEWTLSRATQGLPDLFTLSDALRAFADELAEGVTSTGTVSKPRDAKAARANYILTVSGLLANCLGQELPDETLAALVRVALEDESVTPSLVNKFRSRNGPRETIGAAD